MFFPGLERNRIAIAICIVFCALLTISNAKALAWDDPSVLEAQKVFKQYTDYEHAFDPLQAELYAPNASIKDTRNYQDGPSKTLTWNGNEYKQILKATMPVAKARNEQNIYSQVTYNKEGNNVRIRCTRYSQNKRYSSPLEILLAPSTGKTGYKIVEEISQSQP